MNADAGRQQGVALILVIWAVALLAAIAVVIAPDGRATRQIAVNLEKAAQAKALAEGGLWWGIARLQDTNPATALRVDGHVYAVPLAGETVRVVVEDESGKIDINHVAAPMLDALLRNCGLGENEAQAMTAAVLDHRRRHSERGGALHAAAFPSTLDLRPVTGMSYELYACLEPALTVHSGSAGIDPRTAPSAVLLAIPGFTAQAVQQYLNQRAFGLTEGAALAELTGASLAAAYLVRSPVRIVKVRSMVQLKDGGAYEGRAVVELRRNRVPAVFLHDWN